MSLKQSCFSTIVKSDLKRHWWTAVLTSIFTSLVISVPLVDYSKYTIEQVIINNWPSRIFDRLSPIYFVGMILAGFLGLLMINYINSANSVNFFHGLPIKRNTLLLAHLTSCAILIIIPIIVNTLICLTALENGVKISWLLTVFALYLIYSFLILSLTVVVGMLCGNIVAGGIFTLVVIFLPLFLSAFFDTICRYYLFGFPNENYLIDQLYGTVYIFPNDLMGPKCLVYIILAAICFALSFFIYNKRHLENYGEVIAFPNLKLLFNVLFGLCAGILGYFYCMAFWSFQTILIMLVFGSVGVIIAHMMTRKSFSLKGVVPSLSITAICVIVLFCIFKFDIFGYEKRLPDLDEIEYVYEEGMYNDSVEYVYDEYRGSFEVKRVDVFDAHFTTKEQIQLFRNLHAHKIADRNSSSGGKTSEALRMYNGFKIVYKLKNGKEMKRTYYLSDEEIVKFIKPIRQTDVYRKFQYPILDGTKKEFNTVNIIDTRSTNLHDDNIKTFYGKSDEAKMIIDALKKDRENISFERMLSKNNQAFTRISIEYSVECIDSNGEVYMADLADTYKIDASDINTIRVLEELGLFSAEYIQMREDVTSVSTNVSEVILNGNTYYPLDSYYKYYDERVIAETKEIYTQDINVSGDPTYRTFNEKEDAQALYNFCVNFTGEYPLESNAYLEFYVNITFANGKTAGRTITMSFVDLPEILSYMNEYKTMHY